MSRCFPYPPPGFIGKRAVDEALIQSIKLQKDLEKAAKDRKKEKKREKKEKKKESKKHKGASSFASTGVSYDDYARKGDKSYTKFEGATSKRKLDDVEQLERSDITEEHGQPLSLQNPSYSSESTQHSNKRRKQYPGVNVQAPSVNVQAQSVNMQAPSISVKGPSLTVDNTRGRGNILRIRLPLQKHKDPAASASKEQKPSPLTQIKEQRKESDVQVSKEQICSTSGSKDLRGQPGHNVRRISSQDEISSLPGNNKVVQGLVFRRNQEISCSTSGRIEGTSVDVKPSLDCKRVPSSGSSSLSKHEIEMQKIEQQAKLLFQSLGPPALPTELPNDDDEDWLFGRKHSAVAEDKKVKAGNDLPSCGSFALQPRAQYFAEAQIYALPYTVPF